MLELARPDVSIIIVNWNTADLLIDVVRSLRSETRSVTHEIIVSDNGSQDGSQEALSTIYPDVLLIENKENLGFARANNLAFEFATGRYLCLVNTDIVALDGVLDKMVAHMDTYPDIGVLGPRILNSDGTVQENCRRFPTLMNAAGDYLMLKHLFPRWSRFAGRTLPVATYQQTHVAEVLSGCFLMVRREAFAQVGPLDEAFFFYGEDTDWAKRFNLAGWKAVFYADAEAVHLGGASSRAYPVKYYLTMECADLTYWRKHHSQVACAAYECMKIAYHLAASAWLLPRALWHRSDRAQKVRGHLNNLIWLATRQAPLM